MKDADFILLSKEGAQNYIESQPAWKRQALKAKWAAGEADRKAEEDAVSLDGKTYRAGYFYKDAYGLGRIIGGCLTVISVFVIIAGIITPASTSSGYGDVVNLHAGIIKLSVLIVGFGLLIAGILLTCLNEIAECIRSGNAYRRWLSE